LDFSSGHKATTGPLREEGRRVLVREDVMLEKCVLKMEDGAASQEMQVASSSWGSHAKSFFPEPPEGMRFC